MREKTKRKQELRLLSLAAYYSVPRKNWKAELEAKKALVRLNHDRKHADRKLCSNNER